MKTFNVEVVRTGIGFRTIEVEANNQKEANEKALDEAGDHEFSEKSSEYAIMNAPDKKLCVVLLSVDVFERKMAENIENQTFKTLDEIQKTVRTHKAKEGIIHVELISDFMDACNNQEIELEGFWVSYVFLEEKI